MVTTNSWNSEDPAQVAKGGTGLTTLTNHNLLIGNDAQPIVLLPPDPTEGIPIVSNGSTSDPSYGTAFVVGGGTGTTSFTPFATITAGGTATSPLNPVDPGTAGDVLTSNGPGAFPSYQPGGGPSGTGAFVWLGRQTGDGTSDSLIFDDAFITPLFDNYYIIVSGLRPVTSSAMDLVLSTDNGATWLDSDYQTFDKNLSSGFGQSSDSTAYSLAGTGTAQLNASDESGFNGTATFITWTTASIPRVVATVSFRRNDNITIFKFVGGRGPIGITVNAFRFVLASSNFLSGSIDLYGVRTS